MTTRSGRQCQPLRPPVTLGPRHSRSARLAWLRRTAGHQPPGVLDHRISDLVGLAAVTRCGYLAGALADQRRENRRVQPVQRGVGQVQQGVVLADPFVTALPLHHLEPGRAVAGQEQQGKVAALPAALQEGAGPGGASLPGGGDASLPGFAARLARGLLVSQLGLLPQGDEQLALAAEVVVQAADAGTGPLDDVGDAGVGEPARGENLPGGAEERALRVRGAPPLPSPAGGPGRPGRPRRAARARWPTGPGHVTRPSRARRPSPATRPSGATRPSPRLILHASPIRCAPRAYRSMIPSDADGGPRRP